MRDLVTTILDVLGLLLLAAGLGIAVGNLIGPGCGCIAAGLVVLSGSWWSTRLVRPRRGGER